MAALSYIFPWSIGQQIYTLEWDEDQEEYAVVPVLVDGYEIDEYESSVRIRYVTGDTETPSISSDTIFPDEEQMRGNHLFTTRAEAEGFIKEKYQ